MVLHVLLQFCNKSGFAATSDLILLFCLLLNDQMLCKIGVERQKRGFVVLGLVNAQFTMNIVFELHDVVRFHSSVVINVLTKSFEPTAKRLVGTMRTLCVVWQIWLARCKHGT